MNRTPTLRDLYDHLDWSCERVLAPAESLDQSLLDRSHEMGFGNLRQTLWHVWLAHWVWFRRVAGESPRSLPIDNASGSLADLRRFAAETRATRQATLESSDDADLSRQISYSNLKGDPFVGRLGDILLHVYNHSVHHHVQALNMLRHAGVTRPPRIDYLFMYYDNPDRPAPALSIDLLRDYFAYTDWARELVMSLAMELDDSALDRPFEMGMGSIRRNLVHSHAAELFLLRNWSGDHDSPFPRADEPVPLAELRARMDETAALRNAFLADKRDEELVNPAQARTPDGRVLKFPLGVTAVQLCYHGAHHRAQTINMLRHCGRTTPPTDLIVWARQRGSA